jgi:hypothetical protein
MQFHQVEREPGDYNLELWESETNIWQVRLDKVMYGCRVHVTQRGLLYFQTDYCAGSDPIWHNVLLGIIRVIMSKYQEEISFSELEKIWPRWRIRPMFNDLQCWHNLCEMAGTPELEKPMLELRYGTPIEELELFIDV